MTRFILVWRDVREPYRCGDTQGSAFLSEVFRPALGCERGVIKLVPVRVPAWLFGGHSFNAVGRSWPDWGQVPAYWLDSDDTLTPCWDLVFAGR
jgi:hypothetical protein